MVRIESDFFFLRFIYFSIDKAIKLILKKDKKK